MGRSRLFPSHVPRRPGPFANYDSKLICRLVLTVLPLQMQMEKGGSCVFTSKANFGRELSCIQEHWVITRLTISARAVSTSALAGRLRAREIALPFQATTLKVHFYPNSFPLLTQRLALMPRNDSDQSHDHRYFYTIHETERLARSLHVGDKQQSVGAVRGFEPT